MWWAEARDTAKHPTLLRTASTTKNDPASNVSSPEVEELGDTVMSDSLPKKSVYSSRKPGNDKKPVPSLPDPKALWAEGPVSAQPRRRKGLQAFKGQKRGQVAGRLRGGG